MMRLLFYLLEHQVAPQAGIGVDFKRTRPSHLRDVLRAGAGIGNVGDRHVSLQPIAENAISHGYQGSSGTIHITISGTVDEDGCLHLLICDDGCGFGEEILSHLREEFSHIEAGELTEPENTSAHIGLVNTYRRLFYFSRGAIRMRVRNDGGAVVELIETRTSEEEDDVHHSDRR